MNRQMAIIAVLISAACTLALRAMPFILMGGKRKIPESIQYLGRVLPSAITVILIVYCLRTLPESLNRQNWYEIVAVLVCVGIHIWKKNTLLSIIVSTGLYMILCAVGL